MQPAEQIDSLLRNNQFKLAREKAIEFIEVAPSSFYLHFKLGFICLKLGDLNGATAALEHALRLNPEADSVLPMLAAAYMAKGEWERALYYYEQRADVLRLAPVYQAMGALYVQRGNFVAAEVNFRKALQSGGQAGDPTGECSLNLANVLVHSIQNALVVEGRWLEEAISLTASAQKKLPINKRWEGISLAADLKRWADQPKEAKALYRQAIDVLPNDVPLIDQLRLHYKLVSTLLLFGQFHFAKVEAHWHSKQISWHRRIAAFEVGNFSNQVVALPKWSGEAASGKRLVVRANLNLAEQLLAVRYFEAVAELGLTIIFVSEPAIHGLISSAFPDVILLSDREFIPADIIDSADFQVYLLELFFIFPVDAGRMDVGRNGWLHGVSAGEGRSVGRDGGRGGLVPLKVGIAWREFSNTEGQRLSMDLAQWGSILSLEHVEFFSLQRGAVGEELRLVTESLRIESIDNCMNANSLDDLEGIAAQIEKLDLVISVSNTVVQIAAALGKPVWVLLSTSPPWYWFTQREESVWYGNVRLFRQHQYGHWAPVLEAVKVALCTMLELDRVEEGG